MKEGASVDVNTPSLILVLGLSPPIDLLHNSFLARAHALAQVGTPFNAVSEPS
jgi:hypothetical protein